MAGHWLCTRCHGAPRGDPPVNASAETKTPANRVPTAIVDLLPERLDTAPYQAEGQVPVPREGQARGSNRRRLHSGRGSPERTSGDSPRRDFGNGLTV